MAYDEKLADRVRAYMSAQPGYDEKKMFGGLCFLLNGNMCCGVTSEDLMLRVHRDDYEATLEMPGARPMDFTGRPLTGMVYISPDAIRTKRALQSWLDRAIGFAGALPPKPKKAKRTG